MPLQTTLSVSGRQLVERVWRDDDVAHWKRNSLNRHDESPLVDG
jgi:hypothetical protein